MKVLKRFVDSDGKEYLPGDQYKGKRTDLGDRVSYPKEKKEVKKKPTAKKKQGPPKGAKK